MKTKRERVVITGVGICSAIGHDKEAFTNGLFACESAVGTSEEFNKYFDNCVAAQIKDEVQYEGLTDKQIETYDRVALWGYKVGREALLDADITNASDKLEMGTMLGVSGAATEPFMRIMDNDPVPMDQVASAGNYGSAAPIVTSLLGLGGGYEVVATACTASTNALGLAFDAIQNHKTERMLILGSEPLYLPTFSGFKILDAMAPGPCSPFSGEPGMSVGEGAGALVLETYESAKKRGARIYCEIMGYATSCDAYHETSPEPKGDGATMVMNLALRNSNITADQIEYINAHGTGTAANDRAETSAINRVFAKSEGELVDIPVSSTKSYFGHNISAAGVMEIVACLVTMPEKKLLPTLNFSEPRDYVNLNVIKNEFMDKEVDLFMKNNYAFGGNNCCLIASNKPGAHEVSEYKTNRVAITGMGSISAVGIGQKGLAEGLTAAHSADAEPVSEEQAFQVLNPTASDEATDFHWLTESAQVRDTLKTLPLNDNGELTLRRYPAAKFNARKVLRSVDTRKMHAVNLNAMVALEQCLSDAGLKVGKSNRDDFGMVMGLSRGPQTALDNFFSSMNPEPSQVRTSEFPKALYNSVSSGCATIKGMRGYNTTLATGYSASLGAVMQAYEVVRQDMQPFMLAGGADEGAVGFSMVMHAAHQDEAVNYDLSADTFKPYDTDSKGYHMGEGAGLLMLESVESAQERGATIHAEIIGCGRANSPTDTKVDKADALQRAIQAALKEANISASELDMVCGTSWGHPDADETELAGVKLALGDNTMDTPYTNMNGHLGFVESSGAVLNLMATVDCMEKGLIHPIARSENFIRADFDFVTQPREQEVNKALVVAASESGNYSAIVVSKP